MPEESPGPLASCLAVVFSSQRTRQDKAGYEAAADRMVTLARRQPGFLGVESTRDASGYGITVSYWTDAEAIKSWKAHEEHLAAQSLGKSVWYSGFELRICRVEQLRLGGASLESLSAPAPPE